MDQSSGLKRWWITTLIISSSSATHTLGEVIRYEWCSPIFPIPPLPSAPLLFWIRRGPTNCCGQKKKLSGATPVASGWKHLRVVGQWTILPFSYSCSNHRLFPWYGKFKRSKLPEMLNQSRSTAVPGHHQDWSWLCLNTKLCFESTGFLLQEHSIACPD